MRTLSFLIWSGIFVSFCGSIFVGFFLLLNYIKFNEFDYILLFKVVFVFFIAGFVIPIPELIKLRNKMIIGWSHRWRKRPRLRCLIKKLRILPINVGRTNVQNPLDFVTALLVDRHKRGRLRHRGGK